jgi:ornithine carbamoyltransferase
MMKPSLQGRDFLRNLDLNKLEYRTVMDTAHALKRGELRGSKPLEGKTLAMIFEKPSLRTRTTFDVGMFQLGGHSVNLTNAEIGLGTREPVRDIALNLERWVDGVMARVFLHSTLEELAQFSNKPVLNGLSDLLHPMQLLADFQTIEENFGANVAGLPVTYIGDGNNMANSFVEMALLTGIDLTIATPRGYEPNASIVLEALAKGAKVRLTNDPGAAKNAKVLYTDVWVSMGQEQEASQKRKIKDFTGFQINAPMLETIAKDGIFLHCLPAHYGEEVLEEATLHAKSKVFDQAENRLHAQKAMLYHVLG